MTNQPISMAGRPGSGGMSEPVARPAVLRAG